MIKRLLSARQTCHFITTFTIAFAVTLTTPWFGMSLAQATQTSRATVTGPNGGELTQVGQNILEVGLIEDGENAKLGIWAQANGKTVPAHQLRVRATLIRPGGPPQTLRFEPDKSTGLNSIESITEPHYFDIEVEAQWPNLKAPIKAIFQKNEGLIAMTPEQISTGGVEIGRAGAATLETDARFPGEIKFNADLTAHIVPRVPGIVQSVPANLGQLVKKGDILATLSSTVLSELRSTWLAAKKRRDLAASTYRRERQLWQEQVSAKQDYQQAQTALQEAELTVENAYQKLRAIGAQPTSKDLSLLDIRAPFDGIIVEKHIARGEALTDTSNIFTLSDLSTVWAEFVVAPKDLQHVRIGESARVTSTAFADEAAGTVSYIGALLGQQTRTATARVTLDNPNMAWRPGLFVTVNVVTERKDAPVSVERDAIHTVEDQSVVFVEVPGGFVPRIVKLGIPSKNRIEVISGLEPGTRYATTNAFVLKSELGKATAEHGH